MEFLMSMLAPADQLGEGAPCGDGGGGGRVRHAPCRRRQAARWPPAPRRGFRVEPVEDAGRIVDGPFAEAKELIGGYFVVECDSVDEARELALGNPHRRIGPVVVQPVLPHGA